MKKWILLTLLLIGMSPAAGASQEASLEEVLLTLETPFRSESQRQGGGIEDFQAEFSQQSHIASIDRTQQGEGSVSFRFRRGHTGPGAGSMFRWEYREPTIQEIVSDGRTMWYYLPENRQVIESDMLQVAGQQGENPVTFLSGLGNLSRDFSVAWAEPRRDDKANYILELRPRNSSQYIERLRVVVAGQAVAAFRQQGAKEAIFPIVSTTVVDPNGNRTAIAFHKVRVNQGLSEELFRFQRPEGVEVVRPSEQGLGF